MLYFLIGLSGSGKSYWANKLALQHRCKAIDIDALIISKSENTIADIFKNKGEDYFRKLEQGILKEIINVPIESGDVVIATGAGLPAYENNMTLMLKYGKVIYLEAQPELLALRLQNATDRPLLVNNNPEELIMLLKHQLEQRKQFYEKASIKIDAASATIANFAFIRTPAKNQ